MNRRKILRVFSSAVLASTPLLAAKQASAGEIPISDTHSHRLLFSGMDPRCFQCEMATTGVALLSWALVSDALFIQRQPNGAMAVNLKATPEQFRDAFLKSHRGMMFRARRERLKILKTKDDIAQALQGEPSVVLSTEGSHFLNGDVAYLDTIYAMGIRQMSLGHFYKGELTDIRTESPSVGGISDLGRAVITRCNALGILVDLSHSTDQAVEQALAVTQAPLLWSHSSITPTPSNWRSSGTTVMSISQSTAKRMAEAGGVIGIWPSKSNYANQAAYVDGLQAAVAQVGEDAIAFGTDMDGLSPQATMIENYQGLRDIVNLMLQKNMTESVVRKIAGENYARLLGAVFDKRTASY